MKWLRYLALCFAINIVLVSSLLAANAAKAKKAKKVKLAPVPAAFRLPKEIELTGEQQSKFDELKAQYLTKLADSQKKIADVFTDEQRSQQKTARQAAMAAGKKGKELRAEVDSAVKLTDDQRQKLSSAEQQWKQLTKEVRKQVVALLSDEQKARLKPKKS